MEQECLVRNILHDSDDLNVVSVEQSNMNNRVCPFVDILTPTLTLIIEAANQAF